MIVERIETTTGFAALRDDWNALLENSRSRCIFLTHEWLFTWWKYLAADRSLFILTVRDKGKLVGILPLSLTPAHYSRMIPRSLQFLGSGLVGSDYLDAMVTSGLEQDVTEAFSEHLFRAEMVLHLTATRRSSSLVAQVAANLCGSGWTLVDTATNVCPYIKLRGQNWAEYLSSLGSSHRYNFNRRLRNLQKNHTLSIEVARTPEQAQPALDTVIGLHFKRWMPKGRSEAFQDAKTIAFHREFVELAAAQGWLRILVLRIDGMPAAALYGLRYGETFYFYQSGFDPQWSGQSIGLVTTGSAIKSAIEEGAAEYDFLHGAEEYKYHWASATREIGRLELYPHHSRGRLSRHAVEFNRALRRVAKGMLEKTA
jgi:CelD/BcsL family acetyltransferase involved in cellulose biosynthesis